MKKQATIRIAHYNCVLALVSGLVVTACPCLVLAQNKVQVVQVESKFLKSTETIRVWTPPGYDADSTRRFPVIYCCQNTGLPVRQLAKLMTAGDFPPFLLVNYEGPSQGGEHGAAAAWSDKRQPSGSFFRKEVIPWVDANFRTIPSSKGRMLVGCSKAGGGVMHLGLKYPDLFGAIVSLDGARPSMTRAEKTLITRRTAMGTFNLSRRMATQSNTCPFC